MATKANISIDQGTDFRTTIDLTDEAGNDLDLTVYTPSAQLRRWYSSTTAVDFGAQINNGEIVLTMNSVTTANLTQSRYVYDVILTNNSSNTVTRVVEGIVTVNPRVTRGS
jgi:hypothetical protein